jgi:magnesium-transporting ATPase (P-type)
MVKQLSILFSHTLRVNLIMDTMGALALGTEQPSLSLLQRKPYKRTASLISRPMWRNILCQAVFQVTLLLYLLFFGAEYFSVPSGDYCEQYSWIEGGVSKSDTWDPSTHHHSTSASEPYSLSCSTFSTLCPDLTTECMEKERLDQNGIVYTYQELTGFVGSCVECSEYSYIHTTIIFNAFVFCQLFNEFNARSLFDDVNILSGISSNPIFMAVIILTVLFQYLIVSFGGDFSRTSPLTLEQWEYTIAMGAIALPIGLKTWIDTPYICVGFIMRFIPVSEADEDFFTPETSSSPSSNGSIDVSMSGHETSSHNLLK